VTWPRDALRVRRYVDGELLDERALTAENVDGPGGALGVVDAEWCAAQVEAGRRYRIVIDDPAGDVGGIVVLEGGVVLAEGGPE
jgi:hypothetical protein